MQTLKLKIIILLLFLIAPAITLTAQDDDIYDQLPLSNKQKQRKKNKIPREINSGFLFIDGEYINIPYIVKLKDLKLTINGHLIKDYNIKVENKHKYDHNPGLPPNITQNNTIYDMLNAIEPEGNFYVTAASWYFYTHYNIKTARKKLINYYKSFPCVKNFTPQTNHPRASMFTIEDYQGNSQIIDIGMGMTDLNYKWGPNGIYKTKHKIKQHQSKLAKQLYDSYVNNLNSGDVIVVKDQCNICGFSNLGYDILFLIDSLKINGISLEDANKVDNSHMGVKKCLYNCSFNTKLHQRIIKLKKEY